MDSIKFGICESTQIVWHTSSKQSFEHMLFTCLQSWNKKSLGFYRIRFQKLFYRLVWLNWLTTLDPFVSKWASWIEVPIKKLVSPKGENRCTSFFCGVQLIWLPGGQILMPHFYLKLFHSTFFIRIQRFWEKTVAKISQKRFEVVLKFDTQKCWMQINFFILMPAFLLWQQNLRMAKSILTESCRL